MSKQIQVSDELHARLKGEAGRNYRSISSHIEYLMAMDEQREIKAYEEKAMQWEEEQRTLPDVMQDAAYKNRKKIAEANASIDDLFRAEVTKEDVKAYDNAMEMNCCKNELQPCKHWVWDTASGEGYKNVLSGRLMEVE